MELAFQKCAIQHLQKLVSQTTSQEETAETVVPDSLPDVGRIVGCWGVPVIRSKELRERTMGVSGGVTAWALYVPEDGSTPRQVSAYLPFTMKWELPQSQENGVMQVTCRLRSMDARMLNSRKILLRANVACKAEAYAPAEAQFSTLTDPPRELEVLRSRLPLLLPSELAEKSFLVDEELELPGGVQAVEGIIAYQLSPVLTDSKVLGEKAVFKGSCGLHLVYMTPEERLAVWDFDLPFSQYTELSRTYDQEEELQTQLVMTGAELTADEEGRSLHLKCSLAAQCMVLEQQTVDLVQDLYSLTGSLVPQTQTVPIKSRLDRQSLRAQAEQSFPVGNGTLVDCTVLPDQPKSHREGEELVLETPVWCSVLYYDGDGALQGQSSHAAASCRFVLAPDCPWEAEARVSGPVQWSLGGGTASVRTNLDITADSFASRDLTFISGAEQTEAKKPDPNRPSLIIRCPGPEDTLWTLAKANGSTVAAICDANHLTQDTLEPEKLLLIPVL